MRFPCATRLYILEGKHIEVPDLIKEKNASRGAIKRSLDELAGLTALDFDTEGLNTWFKSRPSFRDLSAFLFQSQNIIANPNVLFYKADTFEHREKLETIFPYIVNAITPQLLAKQHELNQLRKEFTRKRRELDTLKAVSERWLSEIKAKVSEASEFGLIKKPVSPMASLDQLIEILRVVVQSYNNEGNVTTGTITTAINELVNLQKEESNISLELSSLRRRFADMTSLRESAKRNQETLQIQRDRLQISEWLWQIYEPKHDCPICGHSLESTTMSQLNLLYNSLKEIESQAGEFNKMPAAFDREFERVRSEMRLLTEKLHGIKLRREALEKSSEEARKIQYDTLNLSRFIGGLEQSLVMYSNLGKDSEISKEVEEIRIRINELEKEISEGHINKKIGRALDRVNSNAGKILPSLDCERPNDPVSLLIKDLTIKIKGLNREDYLWEVGSGANWLSYHISVLLGLHEYFLALTHSPVPGFIVFDQPSQVYFPRKLAIRESEVEEEYELKDVDIEAVKRIFLSFSAFIEKSKGNFQIIVLEHAGQDTWGGIERIKLVEEWSKDKKLVPIEWLND